MATKNIRKKAKKQAAIILSLENGQRNNSAELQTVHTENISSNDIPNNNSPSNDIDNSDFNISSSECEQDEVNLVEELGRWASEYGITFVAFIALLRLMLKCKIKVPKDGRTILKTPTEVQQRKFEDGIYVHYGVKNALTDFLTVNDYCFPNIILDLGIDGLPLFKSSQKQVWPILANVINTNYVFMVGVYEGNSKPKCSTEYLQEFVSEITLLKLEGLVFADKFFEIDIRCFVMDAPAKSFILGTKGHSGYFSCSLHR